MARKKQNEDLDLTPFIGLFAMLVVLLLVTASWSKLYSFKIKFSKSLQSLPQEEPLKSKKKEVTLKILAFKNKLFLVEEGERKRTTPLDMRSNPYWSKDLEKNISKWGRSHGLEKQITIESVADFSYGRLIEIYDYIFGAGMKVIAISTKNLEKSDVGI